LHGKVPIFFHTGKRSEQIARVNSVSIFYALGVLDGGAANGKTIRKISLRGAFGLGIYAV